MKKGKYVDGFVLAVPKTKIKAYQKIAKKAGKVWMKHGALDYYECVGDDLAFPHGISFPKLAKTRPSEIVVFSFIIYKSKSHRDKVNKKVMKDPKITNVDPKDIPMDHKRMSYGGFKVLVKF